MVDSSAKFDTFHNNFYLKPLSSKAFRKLINLIIDTKVITQYISVIFLVITWEVALSDIDPILKLQMMRQGIEDHRQLSENIEQSFSDLDTTMNFKVNSLLKAQFEQLCKKSHSNPSREIKLFMLRAVKQGRL